MAKPMTKTEWMNWLEKAWDEAQQAAWNAKEPVFECPRCGHCCREWVGLTDGDIAKTMHGSVEGSNMLPYQFARAIEAKLKEKNT